MASIERTAYPRFSRVFTDAELTVFYTPTKEEVDWARRAARGAENLLGAVVLLKCFQRLYYAPNPDEVPRAVVDHICKALGLSGAALFANLRERTFYRLCGAAREYLGITPRYGAKLDEAVEPIADRAAEILDQRVDVINVLVEELIRQKCELPAFRTLDDIAERALAKAQRLLFESVLARTTTLQREQMDRLLVIEFSQRQTLLQEVKQLPKRASKRHLESRLGHLKWLDSLGEIQQPLTNVPLAKIRSFASQAKALDVAELKDITPAKRYTFLLSLIHHTTIQARDDVGQMFLKRIATTHQKAKEELQDLQRRQRELTEQLVGKLEGVVEILGEESNDEQVGRSVRNLLAPDGDIEVLRSHCVAVRVWSGDNYLPLMWKHFRSQRHVLFQMLQLVSFGSTSQNQSLMRALTAIVANRDRRSDRTPSEGIDLSFASERWQKLVRRPGDPDHFSRRALEVCVFCHLAYELKGGDVFMEGSDAFSDYRQQMLTWEECQTRLPAYCQKLGFADNAAGFTQDLRTCLTDAAARVDREFPEHTADVKINMRGEPVLARLVAQQISPRALRLHDEIAKRLPSRSLLDILANIEHWMNFTRHFGPLSGSDPKLEKAAERYLLAIFAIGCNLGPTQAARHLTGAVSAHMLSFVNRRHITTEKLEAAQRELIELYLQLELPRFWGDGKTVAADGTQYDFYEENLLAGYHFRYRKMGAVAYRHVADNYVAIFSHFIPPGVWEAVYVIEGLLKNADLSVRPDQVYSDTQGQSTAVFAFTHLLGIKLLPRIRNWKDLQLFRPSKSAHYRHINGLFGETVDWELIETHWKDLMQIALSIEAGKISSALLLQKLGSQNQKSRLYLAAQELGRVVRTIFLLEWITNKPLRHQVTSTTNKIESYNGFAKWLSFGGEVIAQNDPNEQQKHLRYNDLVAMAVILQNVIDITQILHSLECEGWQIAPEDLAFLSPYVTIPVRRFGEYRLDLQRTPEAWIRDMRLGTLAVRPERSLAREA